MSWRGTEHTWREFLANTAGGGEKNGFVLSHSTGGQEDIRRPSSPIGAVGCTACVLSQSTGGHEEIRWPMWPRAEVGCTTEEGKRRRGSGGEEAEEEERRGEEAGQRKIFQPPHWRCWKKTRDEECFLYVCPPYFLALSCWNPEMLSSNSDCIQKICPGASYWCLDSENADIYFSIRFD